MRGGRNAIAPALKTGQAGAIRRNQGAIRAQRLEAQSLHSAPSTAHAAFTCRPPCTSARLQKPRTKHQMAPHRQHCPMRCSPAAHSPGRAAAGARGAAGGSPPLRLRVPPASRRPAVARSLQSTLCQLSRSASQACLPPSSSAHPLSPAPPSLMCSRDDGQGEREGTPRRCSVVPAENPQGLQRRASGRCGVRWTILTGRPAQGAAVLAGCGHRCSQACWAASIAGLRAWTAAAGQPIRLVPYRQSGCTAGRTGLAFGAGASAEPPAWRGF